MSENAQMALIAVLGTFLVGITGAVTVYLNILLAKVQATKNQAEAATQKADSAVTTAQRSAQQLGQQIEDNTAKTESIHRIVNGRQDALLAKIEALTKENAALKAKLTEGTP